MDGQEEVEAWGRHSVDRPSAIRLGGFRGAGYDKGRGRMLQVLWHVFERSCWTKWWFPLRLRPGALRAFGARVGKGCRIRSGVRIHWPWKLVLGDHCWVGEGAWILNLEPVEVGSNACISQDALICTGGHDIRSPTFEFKNAPIHIGEGAWVGARAVVLPGESIPVRAVVPAGGVVRGGAGILRAVPIATSQNSSGA